MLARPDPHVSSGIKTNGITRRRQTSLRRTGMTETAVQHQQTSGTVSQPYLAVRGAGTTSLRGLVTGSGTLIKSGNGQLNLTYGGANTYSGGTVLDGGTLAMGAWNTTFGTPTSKITANAGTIRIFDNNTTSAVPSFNNQLEIPAGKSVTLVGGSRCSIQGRLTGEGTLNISFPYVRGDVSTDMSAFKGTLNITSGQFRLVRATDLRQARVVLDGDTYLTHANAGSGTEVDLTTRIGSLAGSSTTCMLGRGTFEVGYDNTTATYGGMFGSSATVSKVGSGTWTLTHDNIPIGITVREGTLALDEEARMTGTATVQDGAALDLTGTVQSVNLRTGGVLCSASDTRGWADSPTACIWWKSPATGSTGVTSSSKNRAVSLIHRRFRTKRACEKA